jgi:hypothetical protein
MASWASPDGSADKLYFSTIVQNNLDWIASLYENAPAGGITEALWWETSIMIKSLSTAGVVTGAMNSLWQSSYLLQAIEWCGDQGWTLGHAADFRDRVVRTQIGFLINHPEGYAWNPFPYYPAVARVTGSGSVIEFFTSWAQVYEDNLHYSFNSTASGNPNWISSGSTPIVIGIASHQGWTLVNMGVRHGVANASTALDIIKNYSEGANTILKDMDANWPGFAYAEENP